MTFHINLANLLKALSLALELSSGGLSRHHWRTAMIADHIGHHLELSPGHRQTLLYAALLHDIGAAANWQEKNDLFSHLPVANLYSHAEAGYGILKDFPYLKAAAKPVRHHHDNWDGSSPSGLAGSDIPLIARIINLADACEVLLDDKTYILNQSSDVLAAIAAKSGHQLDPELVRVFGELTRQESFWLDLSNPHHYGSFFHTAHNFSQVRLAIDDILGAAEIFASIIDRTSRFTARHSRTVADVSAFLARAKGYSADETKRIRIAGLLHDLGKLAVPDTILEKPGPLTAREYTIVKQHPYYTHRILSQIDGFEIIAEWAAYHHETLDGTGYPFRTPPDGLRLGCRIVAVADVYAALSEERPYRPPLSAGQIEKIMLDMVAARRLDGNIVKELFAQHPALDGLGGDVPA